MDKIRHSIELFKNYEQDFGLSTDTISQIEQQANEFKLFVPLIGRFSAGKSALINTIVACEVTICKENISPQTALPAEISYGDSEEVVWVKNNEKHEISVEDFLKRQDGFTNETTDVLKMFINSDNLKKFSDIALVDMPGLDSGYESHDRAITDYIQNSMAYALVFPADELIIPGSMEPILKDLNTYDMPMCAVITKGNRIQGQEEESKENLRRSLARYYPGRDIEIFITEKETGQVAEFVDYLSRLQDQAPELGRRFYGKRLKSEYEKLCNYISGQLKEMEMSLSQLEEEKENIEKSISDISNAVQKEMSDFQNQIPEMVNGIASDVQAALSGNLEGYVSDLMYENDISQSMKDLIRNTVMKSYKSRVVDKIEKELKNINRYLEQVSADVSAGSVGGVTGLAIDVDRMCGKEISGVSRAVIDVAAFLIGGPLGPLISEGIMRLFKGRREEKMQQMKNQLRQKLTSEIFPLVDREIRTQLETNLKKTHMELEEKIQKDVGDQIQVLQKTLEDVIQKKQCEDESREQRQLELQDKRNVLEAQWREIEV